MTGMKDEKPAPSLDDVELLPDAMERLERAAKTVFAHPPIAKADIKGPKRQSPAKPKRRRP
jgi:hypothetical protein